MLIICNGAYKSGSTWLFRILKGMVPHEPLPAAFHDPGWEGTGIAPAKLAQFLRQENYRDHTYVIKGHFFEHHHLLQNRRDIRIANIRRDIRDVIVSAFFYEKLKGIHATDTITDYYYDRGWKIARRVIRYNRLWDGRPGTYMSSYEKLHSEFPDEVRRVGQFLGVSLSDADVERLHAENTLESLKSKYDEKSADGSMSFYRKGVVGDWRDHLTEDILAHLKQLEEQQSRYPTFVDLLTLRMRYTYRMMKGQ